MVTDRWDEARALTLWRRGLFVIYAVNLTRLVIEFLGEAPLHRSYIAGGGVFVRIADSPALVIALTAAAVASVAAYLLGPRQLGWGVLTLAISFVIIEARGWILGFYDEPFFYCGAVLAGWIAGDACARVFGVRPREGRAARLEADRFAAQGALALFGACYFNAGLCKLRDSGLGWINSDILRGVTLQHFRGGHPSIFDPARRFLLASQRADVALQLGGLVIELGALCIIIGPRARLAWGILLVSFHEGTRLVAGLSFGEAEALAVLFCFPWSRRPHDTPPPTVTAMAPPPDKRMRTRLLLMCAGVAATLALLWIVPLPPRQHPAHRVQVAPRPR